MALALRRPDPPSRRSTTFTTPPPRTASLPAVVPGSPLAAPPVPAHRARRRTRQAPILSMPLLIGGGLGMLALVLLVLSQDADLVSGQRRLTRYRQQNVHQLKLQERLRMETERLVAVERVQAEAGDRQGFVRPVQRERLDLQSRVCRPGPHGRRYTLSYRWRR